MWRCDVLTLYPDMFPGPLGGALTGRALSDTIWSLKATNIRDFAKDKHNTVDDTPAGGGAGMVMRADVIARAADGVSDHSDPRPRIYLTPRGAPLIQDRVRELAHGPGVVVLCGRFEGVDQRVIEGRGFQEISLGDYVLNGGEIAAMVLIEACVRLLEGVVGAEASLDEESFTNGLLEYPHYTRPRAWEGRAIPDVLLSGDHRAVDQWRRAQAEQVTRERRPDLWEQYATAIKRSKD